MAKKKTTFDLVLRELKPERRFTSDEHYERGALLYAFAGFYHPGLEADQEIRGLPPGRYVVYSGVGTLDEKGMNLPDTLTLRRKAREVEVIEPPIPIVKEVA